MPRMPKAHIEGGLYFTTSRADGTLKIFNDQEDYETYLRLVAKYKQQYGFRLYAYVLLPAYLHLLIELKEGLTISNILHDINSTYTKYYNSKYQRKGHVFQERYRLTVAEKSTCLSLLADYVHTAPLREPVAVDAFSYPHSSLPIYTRDPRTQAVGDMAEIEPGFVSGSGEDYRKRLAGINHKQLAELGDELRKKSVLGSQAFAERVGIEAEQQKRQATVKETAQMPRPLAMTAGGLAVTALIILTVIVINNHRITSQVVKQELSKKEWAFSEELSKERKFIARDLEEKYRADQVSYQAMAKRLEIEKIRRQELEQTTQRGKP